MTDKEKLLAGIKLIEEACHGEDIVEAFTDIDYTKFTKLREQYSSLPASRITLMIAEGWEGKPVGFDFDEKGNFLKRY